MGEWTVGTLCAQLLLSLCDHALKICILFVYNPQIIFCHFFHNLNLSHFYGHYNEWIEGTLCAQLIQLNTDIFETLHCDHALKICMWFGYTSQINFLSLFCAI